MANAYVIQMLGNSACFSSEDFKPADGPDRVVGTEWDHQSRGADAVTASAVLLSQQWFKNSFGESIINPLLLLRTPKCVNFWI